MTKQRMRHKHEKMRYFHLMKVGDRMLSTKISCLRQHVKIHVLKPNTLKPRLAVIQELWFQFLCINPSSEQSWSFFHLIEWQNSDYLSSIGSGHYIEMDKFLPFPWGSRVVRCSWGMSQIVLDGARTQEGARKCSGLYQQTG